jgi:hypothetical protein
MDNPKGPKKIVHASDAYFCIHEFEKDGQVDMAKSRNGVKWTSGEVRLKMLLA